MWGENRVPIQTLVQLTHLKSLLMMAKTLMYWVIRLGFGQGLNCLHPLSVVWSSLSPIRTIQSLFKNLSTKCLAKNL